VLAHVAGVAIRRVYAPGETVILEGDPCQAVYFIVEGQVRIYRLSPEGREQVLKRLGPGGAFNLVPALDGGTNPSSVMAWTQVTLYAIERDHFLQMIHEHPALAGAILADFAAKLRHMTALVEDLSLRTVGGRLAKLLLSQAVEKETVPRRVTQQEMAAQLGTVREVVGRTLAELEREGLIHMERHRIIIVNRAGLEAKASLT
jgi:CRP/FNR family transcriptional regulator